MRGGREVQCCRANGDARWANRSGTVEWDLTQEMLRAGVKKTDTQETQTHTEPTAEGTGQKQKLNVWRSLMSLRFLSTTAGTGAQGNQCVCGRECVCVSEYPPLKHWAVHNLSDSCQLCTSIYSANQILCQQGAQPAGLTDTETV